MTKKLSFGKWIKHTSEFYAEGKVYVILSEGDFPNCVKFINDQGTLDEADCGRFQLSTKSEYAKQQQQFVKSLKNNFRNV